MTLNSAQIFQDYTDEEFYAVVERLKRQAALPNDSFIQNVPFFTFVTLTKESQVKELFQAACDPNVYKLLFQNILPLSVDTEEHSSQNSATKNMMTFAQICLYKVLPCPDAACVKRPREIVTHNQYKDYEYECPFYHHERDRRRIVITSTVDEEFIYKANYFEEGRSNAEKDKYSQNYFESMFHPLYYKMFRCKREYCSTCHFCPFYHSEDEKKAWDGMFSNFMRKDRITYVKDKQKYYESTSNAANREPKSSSEAYSPNKTPGQDNYNQSRRNHYNNNKYSRSPNESNQNYQGQKGRGKQINSRKQGEWTKISDEKQRKNSNDSYGSNSESLGILNKNQQLVAYRVC